MRSNSRPAPEKNKRNLEELKVRGLSPLKGEARSSILQKLRSQQVIVKVTDLHASVSQIPESHTQPESTSDASTQTECLSCPTCQFTFTLESVAVNGSREWESSPSAETTRLNRSTVKKSTRLTAANEDVSSNDDTVSRNTKMDMSLAATNTDTEDLSLHTTENVTVEPEQRKQTASLTRGLTVSRKTLPRLGKVTRTTGKGRVRRSVISKSQSSRVAPAPVDGSSATSSSIKDPILETIGQVVRRFSSDQSIDVSGVPTSSSSGPELTDVEKTAPVETVATATGASLSTSRKATKMGPKKQVRRGKTLKTEELQAGESTDTPAGENSPSLESTNGFPETANDTALTSSSTKMTEVSGVPEPKEPATNHGSAGEPSSSTASTTSDVHAASESVTADSRKGSRGKARGRGRQTDTVKLKMAKATSTVREESRPPTGTRITRGSTSNVESSTGSTESTGPAQLMPSTAKQTKPNESKKSEDAIRPGSGSHGKTKLGNRLVATTPQAPAKTSSGDDTPPEVAAPTESIASATTEEQEPEPSTSRHLSSESSTQLSTAKAFTRTEEAKMIEECKRRIWQVRLQRLPYDYNRPKTTKTLPDSSTQPTARPASDSVETPLSKIQATSLDSTANPPTVVEEPAEVEANAGTEVMDGEQTSAVTSIVAPELPDVAGSRYLEAETVAPTGEPGHGNEKRKSTHKRKKEKRGRKEEEEAKDKKLKKKKEREKESSRSSKTREKILRRRISSEGGDGQHAAVGENSGEGGIPDSATLQENSNPPEVEEPTAVTSSPVEADLESPSASSAQTSVKESTSKLDDRGQEKTILPNEDFEVASRRTPLKVCSFDLVNGAVDREEESFELSFDLSDEEASEPTTTAGAPEGNRDFDTQSASGSEGSSAPRRWNPAAKKRKSKTDGKQPSHKLFSDDFERSDVDTAAPSAAKSTAQQGGEIPNLPDHSPENHEDRISRRSPASLSDHSGDSASSPVKKSAKAKKLKSSSSREKRRGKPTSKSGKDSEPTKASTTSLEKSGTSTDKAAPLPELNAPVERETPQTATAAKQTYRIPKLKPGTSKPHPQHPVPVVIQETDLPLAANSVGLPAFLVEPPPPTETVTAPSTSPTIKPALTMFVGDRKRKSLCFAETNTVVEFTAHSSAVKRFRPEERYGREVNPAGIAPNVRLALQDNSGQGYQPPDDGDDELSIDLDESEYVSDVEYNPEAGGENLGDRSPDASDGAVAEILESINQDFKLDNIDEASDFDEDFLEPTDARRGIVPPSAVVKRESEACDELLVRGDCFVEHCTKTHDLSPRDVVDFVNNCRDLEIQRRVVASVENWSSHLKESVRSEEFGQLLEVLYITLLEADYSPPTVELILEALLKQKSACSAKVVAKVLERPTFQQFPQLMTQLYNRLFKAKVCLDRMSWSRLLRCFLDAKMCDLSSHVLHAAMSHCTTSFEPSDVEVNKVVELFIGDIQRDYPVSAGTKKVPSKHHIASEALKLIRRFSDSVMGKLKVDLRRNLFNTMSPYLKNEDVQFLRDRLMVAPPTDVPPLAVLTDHPVRPVRPPQFNRPEMLPPARFSRPPPPVPGLLPLGGRPMGPRAVGPRSMEPRMVGPRPMCLRPMGPRPLPSNMPLVRRPLKNERTSPLAPVKVHWSQMVGDVGKLFERFMQADAAEVNQIADFLVNDTLQNNADRVGPFLVKVLQKFEVLPEPGEEELPHLQKQAVLDLIVRMLCHYVQCCDMGNIYTYTALADTMDLLDWQNSEQFFEPRLFVYGAMSLVDPTVNRKPGESDVKTALGLLFQFRGETPQEAQTPELRQLEEKVVSACRSVAPRFEELDEFKLYVNIQRDEEAE